MRVHGRPPVKPPKQLNYHRVIQQVEIKTPLVKPVEPIVEVHQELPDDVYTHYTLRHLWVPARHVINMRGPEFSYTPKDWNDSNQLHRRIQAGQRLVGLMNAKLNFFNRLEESILVHGIANPIILTSGYPKFLTLDEIPPMLRVVPEQMLVCEVSGGARLLIAQKHNLEVPAIVMDYVGMFDSAKELQSEADIRECFQHKPANISKTNRGLRTSPLPQTHLAREHQDPAIAAGIRWDILNSYTW